MVLVFSKSISPKQNCNYISCILNLIVAMFVVKLVDLNVVVVKFCLH